MTLTIAEYQEKARAHVLERPVRAHLALADGRPLCYRAPVTLVRTALRINRPA